MKIPENNFNGGVRFVAGQFHWLIPNKFSDILRLKRNKKYRFFAVFKTKNRFEIYLKEDKDKNVKS
jgi:glutamyl-tRNA reductase